MFCMLILVQKDLCVFPKLKLNLLLDVNPYKYNIILKTSNVENSMCSEYLKFCTIFFAKKEE